MAGIDIRTSDQDLAVLPHAVRRRLDALDCAACGAARPLRRGGWAYGLNPVNGSRLAYRVRVCPLCPARVDQVSAPPPVIAWSAALAWAMAAGAGEADVRTAWGTGQSTEVPAGKHWEVARFTRTLGLDAVSHLFRQGVPLGPVLEIPRLAMVEILVRLGTARSWPRLLGTLCNGPGTIGSPAPHLTRVSGHRAASGRHWIIPPGHAVPVTNAEALIESVAAATAHRSRSWLAELPTSRALPR
jgi:hypothetical protein